MLMGTLLVSAQAMPGAQGAQRPGAWGRVCPAWNQWGWGSPTAWRQDHGHVVLCNACVTRKSPVTPARQKPGAGFLGAICLEQTSGALGHREDTLLPGAWLLGVQDATARETPVSASRGPMSQPHTRPPLPEGPGLR